MKKKVALSATAIAVLASTVPTQVAPVEAEETSNVIYVNSTGAGNQNDGGTGKENNPYKQLSTAVANAKDGDTIIVTGEGYVNDLWNGGPWHIDKKLTIKSEGDTPATLSIRPAGIVLGGDVTFENVVLSLYNASSAYIYANGHKLELINTPTTTNTAKTVDLYAGAKDGYTSGSAGSILVKTDNGLKDKNGVTKLGAIYAGGDSGTPSIPTNISVINDGPASSISVPSIVGQDASGDQVSGNMNVILSNISPTVYGGTGTNSLTIGSTYSRDLSLSNIHTLNITNGTIELSDDSVTTINNANIAQGALLDLRNRFDDLTIGTYTGQGGVALDNEGAKLGITQPINTNDSLTVYLGNYTPSGGNGWHSKNYTYVTTANNDAQVTLYGENNFSTGYEFIPVSNEGKYEWKVAKPTPPDEVEPEEKAPVLTALQTTGSSKTVSVDGFEEGTIPSVDFPFNMVTNPPLDDFAWLDQFNPEITVEDHTAVKHYDEEENFTTYRVDELDMTIYFELGDDGDFSSQKMVVLFQDESGKPFTLQPATYDFEISVKDVPTLEFTLKVQGEEEEEQPTLPTILGLNHEGFDTTKTFGESEFLSAGTRSTFFEFKVITKDGKQVLLSDYEDLEVQVNYESTQRIEHEGDSHLYFDSPDHRVRTYFELDEETGVHKLVLTAYDGAPAVPLDARYDIKVMYKDLPYMLFTASIVDDDEQQPPKEEGEEEIKEPILKSFNIDKGEATKTVEVTEGQVEPGELASYTFSVVTEGGDLESLVDYEGLDVTFDGKPLTLITDKGGKQAYRIPDTSTNVYLDKDETTGTYKLRLVAVVADEGYLRIPSINNHTIKVSHTDVKQPLELSLELKEKEVTHPTPKPEEGEEELTPPPTTKPEEDTIKEFLTEGYETTKPFKQSVFKSHDEPSTFFTFRVHATGRVALLSEYPELKVTINGKDTERHLHEDGRTYFVAHDEMIKAYFDSGASVTEQKLVVLSYDGEGPTVPKKSEYEIKVEYKDIKPLTLTMNVVADDEEEPSGGGSGTVTPPTTEPTTPPSTGGTTVTPPPSQGETKPDTDKEEDKKPTSPTPPLVTKPNGVENIEDIRKEMQEKVDSLITEIRQQEESTLTLSLKGDSDDLQNVSTLEVTSEGVFVTVEGERIKFNTTLDTENIDWDNTRINRLDGSPVPHKQNGDGFIITSSDLSDLVISPKVDEPFTDVNDDDWFKEYVEEAYNLGFTTGTTATTFDPNAPVTRAQAAVMLARTFELKPTTATEPTLSDVEDKWYADEVQALTDAGIIKGFPDGSFRGEDEITRQQLALLLTRTLEYQGMDTSLPKGTIEPELKDKEKISSEAKASVEYLAYKNPIISGEDVAFRPMQVTTRAQTAKVIVKISLLSGLY